MIPERPGRRAAAAGLAPAHPSPAAITGLVLAGGRGQRLGGRDKGLEPWHGQALVDHALARLAPQVRDILISANRHPELYAARGRPVLADATSAFEGPLAGVLAGLRAAATPWVAVVPCDAPLFPLDLVARLAAGLDGARAAVVRRAVPGRGQRLEPVFCLLSTDLADDLAQELGAGRRRVEPWLARHARAVDFEGPGDAVAFANFNTPDDFAQPQAGGDPR